MRRFSLSSILVLLFSIVSIHSFADLVPTTEISVKVISSWNLVGKGLKFAFLAPNDSGTRVLFNGTAQTFTGNPISVSFFNSNSGVTASCITKIKAKVAAGDTTSTLVIKGNSPTFSSSSVFLGSLVSCQ